MFADSLTTKPAEGNLPRAPRLVAKVGAFGAGLRAKGLSLSEQNRTFGPAPPVLVQEIHVRAADPYVLISFSALTDAINDPSSSATVFTAVVLKKAMPDVIKMMADAAGFGVVRAVPKRNN